MKSKNCAVLFTMIFMLLCLRSLSQVSDTVSFKLITRLSFYSFEKKAELLLRTPANKSESQFRIILSASQKTLGEWNGKAEKGLARIPVDIEHLSSPAKIEASITPLAENSDEKNIKYISTCILIILPAKSNEVKTDRLTGGLIVNRRQFFPFGFYCYSPVYPSLPEEEAVKGFNMISPYQKILPESLSERKTYMDRCAQLGMKVHYNLLSVSGGGGVGSRMEGYTDIQKREILVNEIRAFMDHPALLSWYIADEPTGNKVSPDTLKEIYKIVKEIDPWHPVSIVFMAPFLSSRKYSNAEDIVMADPYPVPDLPPSMVGEVAGKLTKEFRYEKPVWIVPQAFGGGELWEREPSIQEIRSMTYQSIINGATGIQYFVRQGPNAFPKSVSSWNECGRMASEIAELTPWLLSDEDANHIESSSENISVTSRYHNGQLLILAVNKKNEPSKFDIRVAGIGTVRAKVIFENRSILLNYGLISDLIPAYGSQAYMVDLKKPVTSNLSWSGNMIKDPGFENISSTGVPSACYAKPGNDRGATYFTDSREHIEGNHSLRIITPKDTCGIFLKFYPVTVEAGKSYIISVWSKADPDQRYNINNAPDKPGNKIKSILPQYVEVSVGDFEKARFVPETDWKQFVTFVTIPTDTIHRFKTNVILKMPGQGVAWFDMLQFVKDPIGK